MLAALATIVVVGAIAAAMFVLGSPADERSRRLDQRRVDDLSSIAQRADLFWTRNGRLPVSLDELRQAPGGSITIADPVSKHAYEYRPSQNTFELCAVFERPSHESAPDRDTFWSHGAGRQCFKREVQKVR
jgi:hypothetical protein